MTKVVSDKVIRNKFKKTYKEEFEDANESFMDFLLDLIPIEIIKEILLKGNDSYYKVFNKYK